jgi:GTP-binding protein
LKVISAEFVTSAAAGVSTGSAQATMSGVPQDGHPQIALAGRSNVGKSTLINALSRRQVARTSAAPGKTRLANVYRLTVEGGAPGRWDLYLVDLPGYGYARGGADAAKELAAVAEGYFASRNTASVAQRGTHAALLLVDSRHPGLDSDIQAHRWLTTFGVEPVVIATKIDKLSRADRVRNLKELKRVFGTAALPVSAERGEGLDELWTRVARMVRGTKERR